jgi:hypothetical protein
MRSKLNYKHLIYCVEKKAQKLIVKNVIQGVAYSMIPAPLGVVNIIRGAMRRG